MLAETSNSQKALAFGQGPAFDHFARQVGQTLQSGDLRYSQRLELLDQAKRLGIRRFDANLIIALVQERRGSNQEKIARKDRGSFLSSVGIFALVQTLILAAGWWLIS